MAVLAYTCRLPFGLRHSVHVPHRVSREFERTPEYHLFATWQSSLSTHYRKLIGIQRTSEVHFCPGIIGLTAPGLLPQVELQIWWEVRKYKRLSSRCYRCSVNCNGSTSDSIKRTVLSRFPKHHCSNKPPDVPQPLSSFLVDIVEWDGPRSDRIASKSQSMRRWNVIVGSCIARRNGDDVGVHAKW